jgi:hypothetical protein
MPFEEETDAYPLLLEVLQSVEDELNATSNPIAYASVQTGDAPTIEYAGNPKGGCGELIVSYVIGYPLGQDFNPDDGSASAGCSFTPAHDIIVGVWRCAPPIKRTNGGYTPASAAEHLNSVREVLADKAAMQRGLCKALKGRDYLLRQYDAQGEEGNTVGGVWAVTIGPKV